MMSLANDGKIRCRRIVGRLLLLPNGGIRKWWQAKRLPYMTGNSFLSHNRQGISEQGNVQEFFGFLLVHVLAAESGQSF